MWAGILTATGILIVSMVIALTIREDPIPQSATPLDWSPFRRLLAMTFTFTIIIIGLGELVRTVGEMIKGTDSVATLLIVMGSAGLLAMVGAIVVGVWVSVRIGIGHKQAQSYPAFSWWVINRLAFLVGVNSLVSFAAYFLQIRLGLEAEAIADPAANLMLVIGLLVLLSVLPSGWLADRIGHKKLVALSGIGAMAGTTLLILAPDMITLYVGSCIIGAATGIFYTTNWALGTRLVPKDKAGKYLGISNLAGAGAGAVGGYIGGPIADYFTSQVSQIPGLGYMLIFSIYAVLFLLSTFVLVQVKVS
jgi:hypothetical protein